MEVPSEESYLFTSWMISCAYVGLFLYVFTSSGGSTNICGLVISWSSCSFEDLSSITMSLILGDSSSSSCTSSEWICIDMVKATSSSKVTCLHLYLIKAWYIDYVSLLYVTISNEYSLLHWRIQLHPLVFWNMYIKWTTKYSEMVDFWSLSWEYIFWSFFL